MNSLSLPTQSVLAAGDPSRRAIGRAVLTSFALGIVFFLWCVLVKDVRAFRDAAPWTDDPYDALVSFAMFFVPLTLAVSAFRLILAKRGWELPAPRIRALVRAGTVVDSAALATAAAAWLSVLLKGGITPASTLPLAGLVIVTVLGIVAAFELRLSTRSLKLSDDHRPDWLDDACETLAHLGLRLGSTDRTELFSQASFERFVAHPVRAHLTLAEVIVAACFGAVFALGAALEGDPPALVAFVGVVGSAGLFVFTAFLNSYLRMVATDGRDVRRGIMGNRLVSALLVAAAALPATVAFRANLFWMVGSSDDQAGIGDLFNLLALAFVAAFATTSAVVSLINRGSRSA